MLESITLHAVRQLTNRDSLRDLIVALEAHSKKSYHLELGKSVTRSNLAKANLKRDSKVFEEYAYHLNRLQIIGISLLDKTPIKQLFTNMDYKDIKERNYNQLTITLF